MTAVAMIYSGGADSTTLLYRLIRGGKNEIHALTFDYGQRHSKEVDAARAVIDHVGRTEQVEIVHRVVDVSAAFRLARGAGHCLIDEDSPVPAGEYAPTTSPTTVVPGRNLIFIAVAAAYCEANRIPELYYGAHANDALIYPDCRPDFISAAQQAVLKSTAWGEVLLCAPFQHISKADIIRQGITLGVPYQLTWSCYAGGTDPCGVCPTCAERIAAFKEAGVTDPAMR